MKVIILLCSIVAAFADGTCPENQHYSSCGTACPLTCKNYEDPPTACILICNPGCHCNDGYVKTDDGYCVKPENCPNQDNYVRVQQPSSDRCNLPADTGICRGSFPRYYFDRTTGQCQEFVYGGCGGNENNFRTEDECEQTCVKKADKPRIEDCSGPADSGHCYAAIIRYFYDQNEGTCKSFTYGGCGGNSNNFYTEDECREKCESISVCEQEKMTGPCTGAFRRFHFNRQTGQCGPFVYGGCEGNGNNFLTKDQCESSCLDVSVCEQEKVVGPCKAAFHRFYFDKQTRKCESFIYGGCRGNGNNFLTQKDCESSCVAISVCEQEKIVGPCRGTFRRFYFNKQTGQCESFIYGGCRGNGNNFLTKVHCESSCGVCPENQHYDSCGTACPLTCRNYQNPPEGCILMCNPGCHCNSGYVRNDDGGCIRPENCTSEIP